MRYSDNRSGRLITRRRINDAALTVFVVASLLAVLLAGGGCASILPKGATDGANGAVIENPFLDSAWLTKQANDRVVFRSRKGSRSLEVDLPADQPQFQDYMVPLTPQFAEAAGDGSDRGPAAGSDLGPMDSSYQEQRPTMTDQEIVNGMPTGNPADDKSRSDIEEGLGLRPVEDGTARNGASYLASLDKVKQLFRNGRYEAALIESDKLLRAYPTDPRLHEMRGTLLDRLGYHQLAIRSWQQSLKLDPSNLSLKAYLGRKSDQSTWRKVSSE